MSANSTTNVTGLCSPIFSGDTICVGLLAIRTVIAFVSLLGSCFVIGVIILFKKYQVVTQRLILYLSISAFFQALVYGTGNFYTARSARNGNKGFCILQGFFTLYFDWTSFIWVLCITFNVLFLVLFYNQSKRVEILEKVYLSVDIVIPIIICFFPFINHAYGPAGLWCWISSLRNGKPFVTGITLQFLFFYGPLWLLSFVMLIVLLFVFGILWRRKYSLRHGKGSDRELQETVWRKEIKPIIFFPFVYMAILIFPSINRLRLAADFVDPNSPSSVFFWLMHSITLPLHGTAYALIFGLDRDTLSRIRWSHIKAAVRDRFKQSTEEYPVTINRHSESVYKKKLSGDDYSPLDDSVDLSYNLVDDGEYD